MSAWRSLSLDAKVVGALALGNWCLLVVGDRVVQTGPPAPLWMLFGGLGGAAWLLACGLLAAAYPLRDHRLGPAFSARDRVAHLAAIVLLFVVIPTLAMIVLREAGKPFTYVHDGAIMVEEAARKLLQGQDPYVTDYLDTPLFYWPMLNNPALYHFTYFPLFFLVTAPFVALFDRVGLFFDERYLYLPAYVATLLVLPLLLRQHPTQRAAALSLVAIVALDPQLFPFVTEGRNDFFVLLPLFAGIALLQRGRRTLGVLALAGAAALKLHASLLLPFALAYLWWTDPRGPTRARLGRLARVALPGAALIAATFLPFLVHDLGSFWDDVVAYNAGGSAWSYPISGLGFSALLLASGILTYPQEGFPFAAFEVAAAVPIAAWALMWLRREPRIDTLLLGYGATLLAFAYFGRYFNGNHLGFILAVVAPVPFLRGGDLAELVHRLVARLGAAAAAPAAVILATSAERDDAV